MSSVPPPSFMTTIKSSRRQDKRNKIPVFNRVPNQNPKFFSKYYNSVLKNQVTSTEFGFSTLTSTAKKRDPREQTVPYCL